MINNFRVGWLIKTPVSLSVALTVVENTVTLMSHLVFGALITMTQLMHRMWRRSEQVQVTHSLFAYLRPDCGHSQANVNPAIVDCGPPGT